jgi:hypothetical protein
MLTSASAPLHQATAALSVAPAALAWLRSGLRGYILHVFDRAAYLIDEREEVLLLAAPPVGMGPFTLLADFQHLRLTEGLSINEPAFVRHDHLYVGEFSIQLATAAPWRAAPDWETLRRRGPSWFSALPGIRQILRSHGRGGVFAGFVAAGRVSGARSIDEHLALSARKAADDLLEALSTDDEATLTRSAYGLAGLGKGFTPSGDDFLTGTMFALWATMPAETARRRSRWLSGAATKRTTRASAAWLAAAARGEAAEAWHGLFGSLAGDGINETQPAAKRILQTGHTSGEDALIGFVGGVESLLARVTR